MLDYEVTGIDQSEDQSLILLYFQIVILQCLKVLSKSQNGGRLWTLKLQPSKRMTLGSYLVFQKGTIQLV